MRKALKRVIPQPVYHHAQTRAYLCTDAMSSSAEIASSNILVVDDTPANLRLLARVLSAEGHTVRLAPSGTLALQSIQKTLPDLILLDICMPDPDGYQVCRRLKADDRSRDIPVIFLSALQSGADKVKAFEFGGADYITKPFQTEEVIARVHHQLRLLNLQRQLQRGQAQLQAQNQQLHQEICDRQQAQAALAQERALLRRLIDAIPDFIFYKDDQGRYQLCNQSFADFAGRSRAAILGQTDQDLFSPAAAAHIRQKDHQVLETAASLRHEEWAIYPDGTQRRLDTLKLPFAPPNNCPPGIIGVCRDITDRKHVEEQLQATSSRLSTLIEHLQAGILVEDEERRIVLVNQAFCNLFELSVAPETLVGQSAAALAKRCQQQFVRADQFLSRQEALLHGQELLLAEDLCLTDGRTLERDYIPVFQGDTLQGHLWQYRDISHRKAAEQSLIRTSQALTHFSNSLKQLHRLNMASFDHFDALCEDYLKTGCEMLNFTGGLVTRVEGDRCWVQAAHSDVPALRAGCQHDLQDIYCCAVIRHQKTVNSNHVGQDPVLRALPLYQELKLEAYIGTPIFVEGELYGSFCFFSESPRSQHWEQHEREIIELMAQSIGKFISAYRTEQKRQRAEEALRQSEARFRQLAEHIKNVFWIKDPVQPRFLYLSPAYESVMGRSPQALYDDPHSWWEVIHPEERDRVATEMAQQLQVLSDTGNFVLEYRILLPDGGVRWLRDQAFPIRHPDGQIYRIVGITEDLSDRKRQEEALRLIEEGTAAKTGSDFFQSLVRYLAHVLQVHYAFVSQLSPSQPEQAHTLAFWQNTVLGDNFEYSLTEVPCHPPGPYSALNPPQAVRAQSPEAPLLQRLGAVSYLGVPLVNTHQQVIGYLAVLDTQAIAPDQTQELILKIFAARAGAELERKQVEEELRQARETADRANRAKSLFLANMSHELRTPLNTILGFTQLMMRECILDEKGLEYSSIISRSGEHLLDLINDVLEMSKIEAGRIALNASRFDFHYLLDTLEEMLRLRAQAKGLQLFFDCDPAVPRCLETDEAKLRQVLINLLGNGIKFTATGWVRLRVHLAAPADNPPNVDPARFILQFEVQDTGPGIAPEEVKQLFQPFVQTRAGQKAQEGTGLGLLISRQFVRLMGGDLTIQTIPGQGSTFVFHIQARATTHSLPQAPTSPRRQITRLSPDHGDYRLLVVEDHAANRLLLVELLSRVGFSVKAVEHGQAAVEESQRWRPHLIWMDIQMPVMDGYAATQQIKAANLAPEPVIIALTAGAFEEERVQAFEIGCDDFVRKPFQWDVILNKIAQYLPVQYIHEPLTAAQEAAASATSSPSSGSSRQDLQDLPYSPTAFPESWRQALEKAAARGSDEQILQLLQSLSPAHAELAERLSELAHNFQFEVILNWLRSPDTEATSPKRESH